MTPMTAAAHAPELIVARRAPEVPVGQSAAMREVLAAVEDVAAASTTVLLLGESGTGKEVVARYIHRISPRAPGPYVAVNCAALPGELLESELFGHEKGAFTGATERRVGRIELADRGTLLLDEISEMPLLLQAKLLRVLQEREVDRIGGARPVPIDVRVVATSNRDLTQMVAQKLFRADLYYRLCVFPIVLPPLRERREDITALAEYLLESIAVRVGRIAPRLGEEALVRLAAYDYPGNVRELGNLLERAILRCRGPLIGAEHLDLGLRGGPDPAPGGTSGDGRTEAPAGGAAGLPAELPLGLAELERMAIGEALRRVGGNRTHAARLLGISLRTLRNKLRSLRSEGALSADGQVFPGGSATAASPAWRADVARNSQERRA